MNIFFLDRDPALNARYHVDRHVVKMPLEIAQMLSTARHLWGYDAPYRPTHPRHPMTLWVSESFSNYRAALEIGLALCDEYTYRYGRAHACRAVIKKIALPYFDDRALVSAPPLCMPDEYKGTDPIESYRRYYVFGKRDDLHVWRKRGCPPWFVRMMAMGHTNPVGKNIYSSEQLV